MFKAGCILVAEALKGKPFTEKWNEKHQEYQMVNLCLCCFPSLPLTKTHSSSNFPHNPLQTDRSSKQGTENNKTSVFIVRYIAGMI